MNTVLKQNVLFSLLSKGTATIGKFTSLQYTLIVDVYVTNYIML